MKIKTILLLTIFLIQIVFSQSEYKISAEGFTFDKPIGNNVKLTIFLSAVNIGSVEEFNGQLRNIKLISKLDLSRNYALDSYAKIMDNDKTISGYSIFSLTYMVPKDATDLSLVLPDIYGNLTIPITTETYDKWLAKSNTSDNEQIGNKSKSFYPSFTNYVGIGVHLETGILKNTNNDKTLPVLMIGFEFLPKIKKFGKTLLFSTISYSYGGLISGNPSQNLKEYYQPDTSSYKLESKNNSWPIFGSAGIGLGLYFDIGKIKPMFSIGVTYNYIMPIYVQIVNKNDNNKADFPTLDGWGAKIEVGAELMRNFLLSYTFRHFETSSRNPISKIQNNSHNLKFAIWGWDK